LSATKEVTNKVSTFDEISQTWTSYYPDLLSLRRRPGVVTHLQHVIVAGGYASVFNCLYDIEVLNWTENSHWREVSIKLPEPMSGFTPIISSDHYVIVGYGGAYTVQVSDMIRSSEHQPQVPAKWITMDTQKGAALVPGSSPLVVVGGCDQNKTATSDIKMYDGTSKSWRNIASLSSVRAHAAVAAINNNAIIVFGGCTKTGSFNNCQSSSLVTVELGQVKLTQSS